MGISTKWSSRDALSQMISKVSTPVVCAKSDGVVLYTACSLTPSSNLRMLSWTPFQCPCSKGPPSTSSQR